MNGRHYFSLSTTADKIGILIAASMAGIGLFFATTSWTYILFAAVIGVCFGCADLLYLLQKKWPRAIAVFAMVMIASTLRDLLFPTLGRGEKGLVLFQFLGLMLSVAMTVVAMADWIEPKKRLAEPPLQTPVSVTPAARAPVAPPSGTEGGSR
jgi:hypothetical protein